MLAQTSDEIAEEKKVFERNMDIFSEIDQYERKCICKKNPVSSDFISLGVATCKQQRRSARIDRCSAGMIWAPSPRKNCHFS